MPHIVVEHTNDIKDVQNLLNALHHSLASQETVTLNSIKTRSIPLAHAVVGDGSTQSMVHITLRLLSGRSDMLLTKMTGDLAAVAMTHCGASTRVTVESVNLYDPSYKN